MDTTLIIYESPHFWQGATALILLTLYLVYFLKCRTPHFLIKGQHNVSRKNLKNPPPPYPNGWYNVCMTKELLPKQAKSIDINGHNLVVYRGANGQAYALAAYCLHLGANLGVGGEVVN